MSAFSRDATRPSASRDLGDALRAAAAGAAEDDPAPLLAVLRAHGLLAAFAQARPGGGYRYAGEWREVLETLSLVGGVDLASARLLEGHLNALQLVALYGTAAQQERVLACAQGGGLLGVWGADAEPPMRMRPAGAGWALAGAKRYASGVGAVALALVPVTHEDGAMQLLLLPTDEAARADASSWNHRGMRRSVSGRYDFEGLAIGAEALVGARDDYRREPFFVGGIWRCAAAQLGALEALVRVVARDLGDSGRIAHPLQMARVGEAILAARGARLWVEDAACRVETLPADADAEALARTVSLSAYARLATERAAMEVIDLAERAIGLGAFALSHPAERVMRDLAVYIRQANPDAVLLGHGRVLMRDLVS